MTWRDRLIAQFGRPTGWIGRVAGWVMATRPSNRARNRWTVEQLALRPTDRVLELGYGPGLAIALAAARVPRGEVIGVDHSEEMRAQATARNRDAVADGRVRLEVGDAEALPAALGQFDAIFSANVAMFWRDPVAMFRALLLHLVPGGVVATTYQPRHRKARPEDADAMADRLAAWLREAGYGDIRVERLPLDPLPAVCVIGHRPRASST